MANNKTATTKQSAPAKRRPAATPARSPAAAEDLPDGGRCVVAGVGASAGGLAAYKQLLRTLPERPGIAFVLVQHLDPTHESMMVELLSKYTPMPVTQIEDGVPVRPNQIYMIPPNRFVRIEGNKLLLDEPIACHGVRLPIDHFFESLAKQRRQRAICIVLSGTGSDGTNGMREVKAQGGMTLVERPENAEYDGMPRSAVASGAADFVVPIEDMADLIVPYARHPYVQAKPAGNLAESAPGHFDAVLALLRTHAGLDFSRYKSGTLTRRIERRMGIRRLRQPSDYLGVLRQDSSELHALFKDMLIGVTSFVRDPLSWDQLRLALEKRLEAKRADDTMRVWVPGCSSGEEAYTVAMLLFEIQERQNKRFDVQVFATDVDADAIEVARQGLYLESVTKDLPDAWVDRYFHREGDRLRVRKRLRERCIFAVQNLLADPPFSSLDLVCCRNLLIYLDTKIQHRVFEMLHFALKPGGLLFLGSSESPTGGKDLFAPVSQADRIYEKRGASNPGSGRFPIDDPNLLQHRDGDSIGEDARVGANAVEIARSAMLQAFAPASVLVDRDGMIQFIHGPVREYMDFPSGDPQLDVAEMAFDGLKAKLRTVLNRVHAGDQEASLVAPQVRRNGANVAVRVEARALARGKRSESLWLVSFRDEPAEPPRPPVEADGDDAASANSRGRERLLAQELQSTREDLQSTIEELESSNEELKASNEEVMSMNEELQSTNEELQTSREELQSLNEELTTVNNQLHDKVEELELTTDDLTNLLASTEMATLFLDVNLRIRRFTPATMRLMSLRDSDIGRPLNDLSRRVNDPDLDGDAVKVLRDLATIQKQVKNGDDETYMRRVSPFRTGDNKIDGVVITYADISQLSRATQALALRERQQASVTRLGRAALAGEEPETLLERVVHEVVKTLGVDLVAVMRIDPSEREMTLVAGVGWEPGLVGSAKVPTDARSQGGFTLISRTPVICEDLENETRFSGSSLLDRHGVRSGLSVIVGPEHAPWGVLGAHARAPTLFSTDASNYLLAVANLLWEALRRHLFEAELRASEQRTASFLNNSAVFAWMKDAEGRFQYLSETYRQRFAFVPDDWQGKTDRDIWGPQGADAFAANDRHVLESGEPLEAIESARDENGKQWHFAVSKFPFTDAEGRSFVGGLGVDITARVDAEAALAASQSRLQQLINSASVGIAFAKPDGTIVEANDAMLRIFGIAREDYERHGWDWQDSVLPLDCEFAEIMRRLGERGDEESIELRREDAGGEKVWVLASARHVDQAKDLYVAFMVDITAQKKTEIALAESEDRLRLAARMAGFGTFYVDVQAERVLWSPETRAILGLPVEAPVETRVGEVPTFVHPEDRARVADKLRACLDPSGDGSFHDEHRILRPDGALRWVLMQGRTQFGGQGDQRRALRVAGVLLDITERHGFEEMLEAARRQAESANAAKSEFLANMSHELRTPLTAILGFAEMLRDQLSNADDVACIDTIKENGDHLCQILDDVLDLAKIEAGKLQSRPVEVNLVEMVTGIRDLFVARAGVKGLALTLDSDGKIPVTISSDRKMLRQVLFNLVGNAVNFTETGQVRIRLACDASAQRLTIAVSDTGIGIDEAEIQRLFEAFEQVDSGHDRQVVGTGLGLAITRKLTQILGGEVSVESALGVGSTFTLRLPTGPLDDTQWVELDNDSDTRGSGRSRDTDAMPPRLDGRILAVDDRREIRFLIKGFLESAGAEVVTSADGPDAIAQWCEHRDRGESLDAVLMDIRMPGMDGLETTRRLRRADYRGPIVALTANLMPQDRDNCLEAGCDGLMGKPIDRPALIRELAEWLARTPSSASPPSDGGPLLLCVDDHADMAQLQKQVLEKRHYRVEAASSAAEALQLLEHFHPEAALIDFNLGDTTGDALVQAMRELKDTKDCVFVCLSGCDPSEIDWRAMGFDHYLQKPAGMDDIDKLLRSTLGRCRARP